MPFDLNKLVKPECGGANPLVATARQIAMRPSTSSLGATSSRQMANHRHGQRQEQANFSKEFLLGQQIHLLKLSSNQSLSGPQKPTTTMTAQSQRYPPSSTSVAAIPNTFVATTTTNTTNLNFNQRPSQAQMSSLFETQLETKYRNDILSVSTQHQTNTSIENAENQLLTDNITMTETPKEKVDDVEFWQTLSQHYVGPPAFVAPSEQEYIFDERNPLKDQFEDPFAEGLKKLDQGDIPSAALLFEAAVLKEPEDAAAWRYLGTTQAQNEKDISAIRALKNCLKIDANDQEARLAISVSLANEHYKDEACHYLLEWLINQDKYKSIQASFEELNRPTNQTEPHDSFSANTLDKKHYSYVRDKFVEAARMSPNNPDHEVQSSLGVLFNMNGEYDKAVDCFKAALSVRSNDSLLWNRLGATLANGNKSDEAVIAYRKALDISPGFLRSRYNLAISLIHLNAYDEAAKQLVQILNMQAAGKGSKNAQIRTRSITSTGIWNTLRTVTTLLNRPELYSIIDGRDLARCNEELLQRNQTVSSSTSAENTTSN